MFDFPPPHFPADCCLVYNHVLRLDLNTRQWSLVDNYGDIPGVRMGHTANLWQGSKLLVYGGENEHRQYLSDVIIFDLETAHWTLPDLNGSAPRGRARHSAVIHDEKLYILGGMTGNENRVLDDICYLDLKTWTWSRTWRFVPRYDHTTWIWGGRIWVFGGMNEEKQRMSELWWLDLRGSPVFDTAPSYGTGDRRIASSRSAGYLLNNATTAATGSTGYAANSSSVQVNPTARNPPVAPGSISSLKFISSPELPQQANGTHFHVYSSGCLLDFVTPASVMHAFDTSLSALDLDTLKWQRLADGRDLFNPQYRWHYCAMNEDGTQAWLLGCPVDPAGNGAGTAEEYLSDVLPIDLRKLGLLGNSLRLEMEASHDLSSLPASDTVASSHLSGIGADLALMFDQPPETGSGTDFIVTGVADDDDESVSGGDDAMTASQSTESQASRPIHVHLLILQARWPHFKRLYNSQMLEFHTKKLHIPEPYSAVRAFLKYLYTDSIAATPAPAASSSSASSPATSSLDVTTRNAVATPPTPSKGSNSGRSTALAASPPTPDHERGPSLEDVAGMLVLSQSYFMPKLRHLCTHRLYRELDVASAAVIWDRAGLAGEAFLRRHAAAFIQRHWGRVVRTKGFLGLGRDALVELCAETDEESRLVSGEELEIVGGLGGAKFGVNGLGGPGKRKGSVAMESIDGEDVDGDEDEGMDVS